MVYRDTFLRYVLLILVFSAFCYFSQPSYSAESWIPINTGLTNTVVNAVAINPSNTQILYAGTGGGGVFKSTDGGKSWIPRNDGLFILNVKLIVLDPLNPDIIYVGTSGHLTKSTNGGSSWETLVAGTGEVKALTAFVLNSSTVLLRSDADDFYIYRSSDGGHNWQSDFAYTAIAFAINPMNPVLGYAATMGGSYGGVRRTKDAGVSWDWIGFNIPTNNVRALAIDPKTPTTLYCGPSFNGVWKTTQATDTYPQWFLFSEGLPISATAVVVIKVDPVTPQIVYAGTDGYGVYRSTDSGTNWAAYNDGLTNLSITPQALAIDPKTPSVVYVGTNGGGIFRFGPSALPQRPGDTICYPQLAVGGGYQVVLLIQNNSTSAWKGRAEPLLKDGSLDYLMTDINLAAGETQKIIFTGGSTTISTGLELFGNTGYATSDLSITYFFNYFENGKLRDSIGVSIGKASKKFTLPVEEASPVSTGLAVRRLPYTTDSQITITLRNAQGTQVGKITRDSDFAMFVWQIFSGLPANFVGSMTVESDTEFYLIALRMESTDIGFQFTSVPPTVR